MRVISVNVGAPRAVTYGAREFFTGGDKRPVKEAMLRTLHFDGDEQADLTVHGGPHRAVCVYSFDHYPFWEEWAGEKLEAGAFSENLTIEGVTETAVCIGDTFACGDALVQVSQPRLPCSKLAGKRARADLPEEIRRTLFTGFYLRVLREGLVRAGDAFEEIETHVAGVTVAFAAQVMLGQRTSPEDFERVLAVAELSPGWRESLSKRKRGVEE
jgi:MOSC domain-containing protein YiiM